MSTERIEKLRRLVWNDTFVRKVYGSRKVYSALYQIIDLTEIQQEGSTEEFQRGWNLAMSQVQDIIEKELK